MKVIPNEVFFSWVRDSLAENGSVRFKVKGVSMQPLLRNDRDEVLVLRYDGLGELKRGDIVLFKYGERHVLHRIIKISPNCIVLRGDNAVNREYCRKEDILGVVDKIYRLKGNGTYREGSLRWPFWRVTSLYPRLKYRIYRLIKNS